VRQRLGGSRTRFGLLAAPQGEVQDEGQSQREDEAEQATGRADVNRHRGLPKYGRGAPAPCGATMNPPDRASRDAAHPWRIGQRGCQVSHDERRKLLEHALADVLPDPPGWTSGSVDPADPDGAPDHWLEVASPVRPDVQQLVVLLRRDGDIQVEYHVAEKRGSPFEALFLAPDHQEGLVIDAVARFVGDLVSERLVLAYARGLFRGGRAFVSPAELGRIPPARLSWVTSWRGTFDR
jgi:hypothetical protein